eukprot:3484090-Rhodomonas_salina.1
MLLALALVWVCVWVGGRLAADLKGLPRSLALSLSLRARADAAGVRGGGASLGRALPPRAPLPRPPRPRPRSALP